jgi:hypothetical protein
MRRSIRVLARVLAGVVALAALACAGDPALRIEARRARYTATAQSFVVRDDPGAAQQQVVLDVLVGWRGGDPLPGLTVDVSMADPTGKEKEHRRAWLDVSKVDQGGAQMSVVLDDVPYQAGDGFYVEVRTPVPAAERANYREFAAAR